MLADGIVRAVRAHTKVMAVNMPPRRNIFGRLTDRLPIAQNRLALGNRANRNLMAARHRAGQRHAQTGRRRAFGQIGQCDDKVVNRVQSDNSVCHNVTLILAAARAVS